MMLFRLGVMLGVICLIGLQTVQSSPITIPLKPGGDLDKLIPDYFDTKRTKSFHNMSPNATDVHPKEIDVSYDFSCNIDMKLRWSTMVGSPVYSTPVAFTSGKNDEKQIYLNTYYQYIESLNHDGYKSWGWPLSFEDSSFQASPLIYDIDGDGNLDIGVVDKNGDLYWIRTGEFGEYLEDYHIQIPKLKVKRDWYEGLDPAYTDRYVRMSMFDKLASSQNHIDSRLPSDVPPVDGDSSPQRPLAKRVKVDDLKEVKRVITKPGDVDKRMKRDNKIPSLASVAAPKIESAANSNKNKEETAPGGRRLTATSSSNMFGGGGRRLSAEEEEAEDAPTVRGRRLAEERALPIPGPVDVPPPRSETLPAPPQVAPAVAAQQQADSKKEAHGETTEPKPQEKMLPSAILAQHEQMEKEAQEMELDHGEDFMGHQHVGEDDYIRRESFYAASAEQYAEQARLHEDWLREQEQQRLQEEGGQGEGQPSVWEDGAAAEDPSVHYGYAGRIARGQSFDDGFNYYAARRYGGQIGEDRPANESKYVLVDAHVLTTPVMSDINGDGHMEIIFAVSYYFDKVQYANKPTHFDPEMYVAGGIVCWDMEAQDWTWMVHLDLTTTKSKFQAMIYATPTVADLDGDGRYEIIVGTSLGLLYLLDGDSGFVRRYFPMQFNSIQAQVAVGNVLGGRALEIIVADMGGTVAVVNIDGDIMWDVHLSGSLPFTPTLGDVDGDGTIDIVVVAVTEKNGCHIYALHGDTGETLEGYPIALPEHEKVTSSVLLVDLHSSTSTKRFQAPKTPTNSTGAAAMASLTSNDVNYGFGVPITTSKSGSVSKESEEKVNRNKGLHMVVSTFDGHVYILGHMHNSAKAPSKADGKHARKSDLLDAFGLTGGAPCAQRIDVGEHIYSHPLIDDISGDGYLDIVIGTMDGQVLLFETAVPYNPLNAWSSFPKNRLNGFTHADKGVFVSMEEKDRLRVMDVKGGRTLSLTFDIFDARYAADLAKNPAMVPKYTVKITKGTNRLDPVHSEEFNSPGRKTITFPVNPPESALYVVSMIDEHGLYYEDTLYISLSTKFYVWLKYMVISPVVVLCLPLLMRFLKYI